MKSENPRGTLGASFWADGTLDAAVQRTQLLFGADASAAHGRIEHSGGLVGDSES